MPRSISSIRRRLITIGDFTVPATAASIAHPEWARNPIAALVMFAWGGAPAPQPASGPALDPAPDQRVQEDPRGPGGPPYHVQRTPVQGVKINANSRLREGPCFDSKPTAV